MNTITELLTVAGGSRPPDAETLKAVKEFIRRRVGAMDNPKKRFQRAYISLLDAHMAQVMGDHHSRQKSLRDLRAALGEQQQQAPGSLRTKSAAGTRIRQASAADGCGSSGYL